MLNNPRATGLVDVLTVNNILDKTVGNQDLRCGYPSLVLREPVQSLDHRLHFPA
jgi:hypothetical protein